uniref:Hydroxysteroid dehydrogenase-like protein 2 n=1 Tax=Dicentrarchus labrax TaxID=13489 RepID=A0A8C4GG39_DICLA
MFFFSPCYRKLAGIGKAIALKAARDGANIIIAAKTAVPHPKLPGTIYSAAEEGEDGGRREGKALACIVDIRDEQQIGEAVQKAVDKFGGIDILVNNASAISLTGTLETPMKKVDLMLGINLRGTYLTSKMVLPHLLKGHNPHILNLSLPLNLNPVWFKNHTAYTMAKYGMSMCVLGMAEEFRGQIAVNALWPKTAIQTAAMDMLGGDGIGKQCRTTDIIADAAYAILSRSKDYTGHFLVDEDVLKEQGVQNFDQYAVQPGHPLLPDFFLDDAPETLVKKMEEHGATPAFKPPPPSSGPIESTFDAIRGVINEDVVKTTQGIYQFDLSGNSKVRLCPYKEILWRGPGQPVKADVIMAMDSSDFSKMFAGEPGAEADDGLHVGKLRIKGDMTLALKLEKLMTRMSKAKL